MLVWPWGVFTAIAVAGRLFAGNAQLDWDEELYWQVAHAWADGRLPYAEVFDHKAPLVYVLQLAYSGFTGSLWLFRATCTLMLVGSALSFGLALWPGRHDLPLVFTFLVVLTLSSFGCIGANTEHLYVPYILLAGGSLLRGRALPAAIAAAVAVNTKYTVGVDIVGLLGFLVVIQRLSIPRAVRFCALFVLLTLSLWMAFYSYFQARGVDLIETTIIVNLFHAANERRPVLDSLGSYAVTQFVVVAVALIVWSLFSGRGSARRLQWGVVVWVVASVLQAAITGKTYYHYFIPIYLPLCVFVVSRWERGMSVKWNRRSMILGGALALALFSVGVVHQREFSATKAYVAAELCPQVRGRSVYVADKLLSMYRICEIAPSKYMFPPFVFRPHFVALSGSRGLEELREFDRIFVSRDSRFGLPVRKTTTRGVVEFSLP